MKTIDSPHIVLKIVTIVLLILLTVGGLYKLGIIRKNCEQDKECFSEKLAKCSPAKYDAIINNNYYEYFVKGTRSDGCVLHIKLKKMGSGTPLDQIKLFEGKEMTCIIPEDELDIDLENINNLLNHCTGNLKEAIYEHIITKMYGLVLKNIDPILDELGKSIK